MARSRKNAESLFAVFNEIAIIAQLTGRAFERALPDGLTTSQFSVLNWFVRVDRVATPARLARAFMVTPGAMTNTLQKLEAKGLVEVKPDEMSARQKCVTLTDAGRRQRDEAIAAAGDHLAHFASILPVNDLFAALPLLQQVRQSLDEDRYGEARE